MALEMALEMAMMDAVNNVRIDKGSQEHPLQGAFLIVVSGV